MNYQGLDIQEHISLKNLTTFGIGGKARYLVELNADTDLKTALDFVAENDLSILILGGGSNMLLNDQDFPGLVIVMNLKGIKVVEENEYEVSLKIAAGEVWDEAVAYTVQNTWWGIENLSHIPGKVGASVVQNIGAYGQEIKDSLMSVEVYNREKGEIEILNNEDCQFAYRLSIFNSEQKNKYIILSITLKLYKIGLANLEYLDLERYFQEAGIEDPSIAEVRQAVIEIRDRKLPHPKEIGNAGSFFKNLLLDGDQFALLNTKIVQNFGAEVWKKFEAFQNVFKSGQLVKIPSAYLIDLCGLKGFKVGGAQVHERAALVIINHNGQATAQDVLGLMQIVRSTVYALTGMELEIEPNFVGFSPEELVEFLELDEVRV